MKESLLLIIGAIIFGCTISGQSYAQMHQSDVEKVRKNNDISVNLNLDYDNRKALNKSSPGGGLHSNTKYDGFALGDQVDLKFGNEADKKRHIFESHASSMSLVYQFY